MPRGFLATAFGLSALFMALIALGLQASAQQPERPPVPCIESPLPIALVYGDHTICTIDPATDSDRFEFSGAVGDRVRLVILSRTNGIDPQIQLRNPVPPIVVLEDEFCSGGPFNNDICFIHVDLTLPETGTYSVLVFHRLGNETGDYLLQLERFPPPATPPFLAYDVTAMDSVTPQTDIDFFVFDGAAGTTIRLSALSKTFGFDMRLEVREPDNALLHDDLCSGGPFNNDLCTINVDLSLTKTGTYLVAFSDSRSDEAGDFEISLQCIVGACPIAVTVTVPDVTGLSQADAEAAIVAAGLLVGAVTLAESVTVLAGDVISQDPGGGSQVQPGDPVDLVISTGPSAAPSPVLGVIESVDVGGDWQAISIPQIVDQPVVIAGVPTAKNKQPGVVRLRNITSSSVEARFQEWSYLDDNHPGENLAMLALGKGRHKMADGSIWEVGVLKVRNNRKWKRKKFQKRFRKSPELFLTVQSNRGETPVTVRARNVTKRGFEAALLEEEKDLKTGHPKETVGYLAVFSKKRSGTVVDDLGPLPYRLKRAKVNQRFKKVLGKLLKVEEERSKGRETKHGKEEVSTLVVGRGVFAQQVTDREPDTTTIRRREP